WRESIARARAAKHPAPVPSSLAIMRERKAAGDSLRAIAAHVNALGLRTPGGAMWYASTVRAA
ncbi:MAG: recombinase family protein, partial [Bryobacteraceae bacterium]